MVSVSPPHHTTGATKLRQRLVRVRGTANDYALELGISRSHLWNLASGVKRPSLDLRFKLEKLFKIGLKEWDP